MEHHFLTALVQTQTRDPAQPGYPLAKKGACHVEMSTTRNPEKCLLARSFVHSEVQKSSTHKNPTKNIKILK